MPTLLGGGGFVCRMRQLPLLNSNRPATGPLIDLTFGHRSTLTVLRTETQGGYSACLSVQPSWIWRAAISILGVKDGARELLES